MMTLRATVLLATTMALAACGRQAVEEPAAGQRPVPAVASDGFADFDRGKVHSRWCLQNTFTVIQTNEREIWRNAGEVKLGPITHTTTCRRRDLFSDGDKLSLQFSGGQYILKVKRDPPRDLEAHLSPEPDIAKPRYLFNKNGDTHLFVFLAEMPRGDGTFIKYYLIEAFPQGTTIDQCRRERPDYPGSMVELANGDACPIVGKDSLPAFSVKSKYGVLQTDVGGGGEGK